MFKKYFYEKKIKGFWSWFAKHQNEYYHFENNQDALFNELSRQLRAINNDLVFEFSPVRDNGKRELSISADGIKSVFQSVIDIVDMAPELSNWIFNAFRQAVPGDELLLRFGPDFTLGYSDIFFYYNMAGSKIDIQLYIKGYDGSNRFKNAMYVLLDGLIGEYNTETKLGIIDFKSQEEQAGKSVQPFIALRDIINKIS